MKRRRFTADELAYLRAERAKTPPTMWKTLAKRLGWRDATMLAKAARYHDMAKMPYRKIVMADDELEKLLFCGYSITKLAQILDVGVTTIIKHKRRLRSSRSDHAKPR